jgi:hypothetical protein
MTSAEFLIRLKRYARREGLEFFTTLVTAKAAMDGFCWAIGLLP